MQNFEYQENHRLVGGARSLPEPSPDVNIVHMRAENAGTSRGMWGSEEDREYGAPLQGSLRRMVISSEAIDSWNISLLAVS